MKPIDTPLRPAFESLAAIGWLATATGLLWYAYHGAAHHTTATLSALVALSIGTYRLVQTITIWERKLNLLTPGLGFVDPAGLKRLVKQYPEGMWLGKGFDWEQRHAQMAFEVRKLPSISTKPPNWYAYLRGVTEDKKALGSPWIHGIDPDEKDIVVPLKHLEGHTLILGTTGSGKTRALETMIVSMVYRGEVVVIIDPKGDRDLRETAQRACILAGRPHAFQHFHPAFPERSVRIDPLRNFSRTTEIASRVAALVPSETGSDAFVAFSWRAINVICSALQIITTRPTLKILRRHIEAGPDGLLHAVLTAYFDQTVKGWQGRLAPYKAEAKRANRRPSASTSDDLIAMVAFYKAEVSQTDPNDSVGGLISMFEHSREHASKMLASLQPVLEMLTAGSLGDLLSPDYNDLQDPRPIVDSARAINEGLVLYVGTDSLSDKTVGSAIGAILLADLCAVAGARYNFNIKNTVVNLIVDEAAECIGDPTIALLNKGRGAGFRLLLAAQTYPDFIARTGSEPKARQILGNINNLIALRTKDGTTMEYIVETMGSTSIMTTQQTVATQAVSGKRDPTNFTASYGERLVENDEAELFAPELLGQLPNFHYVACVSGGRVVKGRFPILKSDIKPTLEELPWVVAKTPPATPAGYEIQRPESVAAR